MKLTYSEIQKKLHEYDFSMLPKLNIVVLRNIMLEPIAPYLRNYLLETGFDAKIVFGEYDCVYQEALAQDHILISEDVDFILIYTKLENLSSSIARRFPELNTKSIEEEINRINNLFANVLRGIRGKTDAIILWHSLETYAYPAYGIFDDRAEKGQNHVIKHLNTLLNESLENTVNAYLVDLNLCVGRIGEKNYYDHRYWHIGKAPYSRNALDEIAQEDTKYIQALKGKNKKCLVLDCDNTLWGGVIGEEGLSGIKLGKTYPGSTFIEFQQEVLNLYNRGVILALCSKNNENDVWEVFDKHPDMVLKKEHISAAQINWEDKATNIKKIASDLNIGLDSLVFVDDSPFEINLVKTRVPEITTIQLDVNKPVEYRETLLSQGYFDALSFSEEDKKRGEMYKADVIRKTLKEEISDLDTYLKSLEMIAEVNFADEFSIPRIAQLTQKTNQFNLTTRRYSEDDISSLAEDENSDVLFLKLRDKFGDLGIIGVSILLYKGTSVYIDSFLLSCRALGRRIENVFLEQCLKLSTKKGKESVIGEYIPTKKNEQVRDFYLKNGFTEVTVNNEKGEYKIQLTGSLEEKASIFKDIKSEV